MQPWESTAQSHPASLSGGSPDLGLLNPRKAALKSRGTPARGKLSGPLGREWRWQIMGMREPGV